MKVPKSAQLVKEEVIYNAIRQLGMATSRDIYYHTKMKFTLPTIRRILPRLEAQGHIRKGAFREVTDWRRQTHDVAAYVVTESATA